MHGSNGNWIHSHQGPTRVIHDLSQTEVCPISMDQVAMLALQLNVPKVALGWSCFLITESDTVSFVVFKLTPPTPSTQVKQSFSIQDHVPLSCWRLEGWSFGKSHEKKSLDSIHMPSSSCSNLPCSITRLGWLIASMIGSWVHAPIMSLGEQFNKTWRFRMKLLSTVNSGCKHVL